MKYTFASLNLNVSDDFDHFLFFPAGRQNQAQLFSIFTMSSSSDDEASWKSAHSSRRSSSSSCCTSSSGSCSHNCDIEQNNINQQKIINGRAAKRGWSSSSESTSELDKDDSTPRLPARRKKKIKLELRTPPEDPPTGKYRRVTKKDILYLIFDCFLLQ